MSKQQRHKHLFVSVTDTEYYLAKRLADVQNLSLSELVRGLLWQDYRRLCEMLIKSDRITDEKLNELVPITLFQDK